MIEPRPPVTILVPIYNGSKYIRSGLDSIAGMANKYDEILLIDDGSEDDSVKQIREVAKNYENMNLITRQHNGLVNTLNFGLSVCTNEFIARADIDDAYNPKRIQLQSSFLQNEQSASAVFCDYSFTASVPTKLGIIPSAVFAPSTKLSLINPQRTPHPGVMFRKSAVLDAGGYLSPDFPTEDYELWIRLSRFSNLMSVPEVLLDYRISPHGISMSSHQLMLAKTLEIRRSLISKLDIGDYLSEADSILEGYGNFTLHNERKVLFIRDLLSLATKVPTRRQNARQEIIRLAFKHISVREFMLATGKLSIDKGRRRRVKKVNPK
jgi:glycosyltransferase involved in cell wall biosynthesis